MYFSESWTEQRRGSYFHVCKYKWWQAQWRAFMLWRIPRRKSFPSVWIWKTPSPQTLVGWFQQSGYHIAMSPTRPAFCAHISLLPLRTSVFTAWAKALEEQQLFYLKRKQASVYKQWRRQFKWQNNAIIFWIILICCAAIFVPAQTQRTAQPSVTQWRPPPPPPLHKCCWAEWAATSVARPLQAAQNVVIRSAQVKIKSEKLHKHSRK